MNEGKPMYFAAAGANNVIATGAAILEKIIIGKDVGSAVIEVSDSPDDGDGDVVIYLDTHDFMWWRNNRERYLPERYLR